jgi:hypothetical protein
MATANKFLTGIDLNNQRGINFADPTSATDSATKQYVDNTLRGFAWKQEVIVATTANITLSGEQTIDGVLTSASRVLVKNQTTQTANGIYVSSSGAWTRATDADTTAEFANGATVSVMSGTTQGDTVWVLTNNTAPVLGTDNITFGVVGGGTALTAGNGITLPANAITVNPVSGGGISVAAGGVSVDRTKVPNLFAANIGDGSTTLITVTHNLNTLDITPFCREISSGEFVWPNMKATGVNTATYEFPTAPTSAQYRAIIHG